MAKSVQLLINVLSLYLNSKNTDCMMWYEKQLSTVMDSNKQINFEEFKKALNITKVLISYHQLNDDN